MKKVLLLITTLVLTTSSIAGGVFSRVSGFGMNEIKPSAEYTVDTVGENPRVYEFTPKGNPNYICIVMFSPDKGYMQMECIPKERK